MFPIKHSAQQTEPIDLPKAQLPTMYDLPSEDPEEPGLPDEFHDFQPDLLRITFRPPNYPKDQVFSACDLNLYYDVRHPRWYKRPDWFGVVGVPRLYAGYDLRLSYVIWQEGVNPFVAVELLSPGTEKEDLGEIDRGITENPPGKWEVYEQILQIPYYVVFDRYTDRLRAFTLVSGRYQELELTEPRIWMPLLELGLGLWQGECQGVDRLWLRWYDANGNWILTEAEQERREKELAQQQFESSQQQLESTQQQLEMERQRAAELTQRLRDLGVEM
jgi:Uma2 family endonuclease